MHEKIIYKEESYKITGVCMEVHNVLCKEHSKVVYKDALEYKFQKHGFLIQESTNVKLNIKM